MTTEYSDHRWTSADGLSLYARDYIPAQGSDALPVIAIHGLTRNSADFETIAPLIAKLGRRVLAVDVRGRGQSDRAVDPMTYRPDIYARDVLALMEDLGLERAIFLGTSMGGIITMVLAALKPEALHGAILNDVGPELAIEGLSRIAAYTGQPVVIANWADACAYAQRINEAAFPHYGQADWQAFARRIFVEGADGIPVLNYDPDISVPIKADAAKALTPDLWPLFHALTQSAPTLLIRGGISDLINPAIVAKMKAAAPEMAYAEVPAIGHAPMLHEPEARAALISFLETLA